MSLARQAREKGGWRRYDSVLSNPYSVYIGLETDVASIRTYQAQLLPGLLQTEDYARAVVKATRPTYRPSEVEKIVAVRMARQKVLDKDDPVTLWAVLDEAVVRRLVGGSAVMREQLGQLIEASERPNVTIQVMPYAAGAHAAMEGPFVILGFAAPASPAIVYLEGLTSGLYLESDTEIDDYMLAFDHLRANALGPDQSMALVTAVAKELG